jgi:hypothetical protein
MKIIRRELLYLFGIAAALTPFFWKTAEQASFGYSIFGRRAGHLCFCALRAKA